MHIIDLSKVGSLKSVEEQPDKGIRIGCMVSLTQLLSHTVVRGRYQALYEALESIGSLQVRNRGTLAGNICNASPAADSVPPLLCFDCTVNVRHSSGLRNIPLDSLITGPGQISLAVGEFVESIDLPYSGEDQASAYVRIGRRKAVDCSIAGVAVRLDCQGNVRAAFGAVSAKPMRIKSVEDMLDHKEWHAGLIERAAERVKKEVSPIDDIRATKAYRIDMSAVLFRRAFSLAKQRLPKAS